MTVKTRFGEYKVSADLFTAKGYNEFLQKISSIVIKNIGKVSQRREKIFPVMQNNLPSLVRLIDKFIRQRLFRQDFDPLHDNDWRILFLSESQIIEHLLKEISTAIYDMQNKNIRIEDATLSRQYFSKLVPELIMRENFALSITKTIYDKLSYPSNKGGLEKNFMIACDSDSSVEALIKIYEHKHHFACLSYIRSDGILANYYPDFLIRTANSFYVVETKANKELSDENVKQKRKSAIEWVARLNQLPNETRDNRIWHYVLLGENTFYSLHDNFASITDILDNADLTQSRFNQEHYGILI